MKPKVVYSDFFGKKVNGIMLYPFIILKKNFRGSVEGEIIKNHESIHFEQAKELWVIGFYLLYAFYFLYYRLQGFGNYDSYRSIPFENEAFTFQEMKGYTRRRYPFTWKAMFMK